MINGRFVVFGSPNYLMEAYGLGYMFTITVDISTVTLYAAKATIQKAPQCLIYRPSSIEREWREE